MTERVGTYGYRRIGVAVSGGADSVFLLHALHELGVAAAVLHINHKLRGVESDADEAFVRELAAALALPVHVLAAPVDAGNVEQEARRARYEFFAQHVADGTCDAVATGHTLDDQAETVLYRFLRGAGTAGLSGILPETPSRIVRPLLAFRPDEIREYLTARNLPWREDASNYNTALARNRIRLHHLPDLAASLNPGLAETLATTAVWAQDEEDHWSAELERLESVHFIAKPEIILVSTKPFLALDVATQRRLMRRGIERVRGSLRSIGFQHIEHIRAMMSARDGSGRLQLPGLDIYRSFDWLRLAPIGIDSRIERDFEVPLAVPGRTEVKARQLTIDMELVDKRRVYNGVVQGLDWEKCTGSMPSHELRLRNWRPGDHYQPQGRAGSEKIKTLFQEHRIPLWERRTWPVIIQCERKSDAIIWSRGFGVASHLAAGPDSQIILTIHEPRESNHKAAASKSVVS